MPSVTVILPTWNRAKWLETAIESVLKQTFQDFELIVVDDASTDSTAEIFNHYSGKISTIIFEDNLGVSVARNAAISISDSEWIAFLDSDDFWHPEKLQKQINQTIFERISQFILLMKSGSETGTGSIRKRNIKNGRAGFFNPAWQCV